MPKSKASWNVFKWSVSTYVRGKRWGNDWEEA